MIEDKRTMPRYLPGGLTLRWATIHDLDAIVEFNVQQHSNNLDHPEVWLGEWTSALMDGRHPTARPEDFTVVVNEKGEIISSLCLIPQTWAIDEVRFGVGQVELVATHPDFRRQGLVREQMKIVQNESADRGHLAQMVFGIPWYYRQFGYEMAVDVFGGRLFNYDRPENAKKVEKEEYRLRPATINDIPTLDKLYEHTCQSSLVSRVRDRDVWIYELSVNHGSRAPNKRHFQIVENLEGNIIGYCDFALWDHIMAVRELAVFAGNSYRAVALFLTRALLEEREQFNMTSEKQLKLLSFHLGKNHPVYDALGRHLDQLTRSYGLYFRVTNLIKFIHNLVPLLEQRLANSVMAGHTGRLRLSLYAQHLQLVFEKGNLTAVEPYCAGSMDDGDVVLPNLTVLQLIFGRASLKELHLAYADCYAQSIEAEILLEILFPKKASNPILLN